jgi:tetratricopeptide (TPR) repeat protein
MEMELDVDALSNRALDAIEARKYDEAEKLCQQLLREYPDVFDGHDRMGELREIQGRFQEAAYHFSKMLEMIKRNPAGTDAETLKYCTEKRDRALAKVKKIAAVCPPRQKIDDALAKAKVALPAKHFEVLEKICSTVLGALKK